jgi:hypothetical protein
VSRSTRTAVPPLELVHGDLLAGRYRLLSRVDAAPGGSGRPAALWLARDEVLTRRVAVKALACERGCASGSRFLDAAVAAGALTSPVLARVYDASLEQRPGSAPDLEPAPDVAYVIREWVDGAPLGEALERGGPLTPAAAVAATVAVAEALSGAHARGLAHGRLHPGNVLVTRSGAVRVTDLAVSAALPDGAAPAGRAEDGDAVADDVRDLTAVLYALLTGRWPTSATPQPAGGVPAAPVAAQRSGARGRLSGPRSTGAAVPRALDAVVRRALDPAAARSGVPLTTAERLVAALEQALADRRAPDRGHAPGSPSSRSSPDAPAPRAGAVRRRLPAVGALALLSALGAGAFAAGSTVGSAGAGPRAATADADPTAGADALGTDRAAAPERAALPLVAAALRDFDPQGDGRERPATVGAAVDGELSTAWTTERYSSAAFGGLKEGVGLLLDLGAPTPVSSLELALSRPGVAVELRAAPTAAGDVGSYRLLAHGRADGERLVLSPPEGTRERFYLVWLTHLPRDGDRFSAGIDELVLEGGTGRGKGDVRGPGG